MPRLALLILILLGLSVLAGCGGDDDRLSKEEYLTEVRKIEDEQGALVTNVYAGLLDGKLRASQCAQLVRDLQAQVDNAIDQVEEVKPPEEVEGHQERFVEAGRETVDALDGIAEQAQSGTLRCGAPLLRRALAIPAVRRAQQVLLDLARKGYRIGSTGT